MWKGQLLLGEYLDAASPMGPGSRNVDRPCSRPTTVDINLPNLQDYHRPCSGISSCPWMQMPGMCCTGEPERANIPKNRQPGGQLPELRSTTTAPRPRGCQSHVDQCRPNHGMSYPPLLRHHVHMHHIHLEDVCQCPKAERGSPGKPPPQKECPRLHECPCRHECAPPKPDKISFQTPPIANVAGLPDAGVESSQPTSFRERLPLS